MQLKVLNLKKMGVMAGFPDLFLFVPKEPYYGLFIELKSKDGRVTDSQIRVMERLSKQGYYCQVCYGAEQAIDEIKKYLELV